jgi:urease accessory protein
MVAGDATRIKLTIDAGAVCFLGTQASSKIYRSPAQTACLHELHATLSPGATLVLAPDPVQCFADAIYQQRQIFELAADSNLILVDWLSAGRLACGERWAFKRYSSRNEVYVREKPLAIDAIELDAQSGALTNRFRAGRFNCLATVLILGPAVVNSARESLKFVAEQPIAAGASFMSTASPVNHGALLRFAGASVEQVGRAISEHLGIVRDLLEDDPWLRKW